MVVSMLYSILSSKRTVRIKSIVFTLLSCFVSPSFAADKVSLSCTAGKEKTWSVVLDVSNQVMSVDGSNYMYKKKKDWLVIEPQIAGFYSEFLINKKDLRFYLVLNSDAGINDRRSGRCKIVLPKWP